MSLVWGYTVNVNGEWNGYREVGNWLNWIASSAIFWSCMRAILESLTQLSWICSRLSSFVSPIRLSTICRSMDESIGIYQTFWQLIEAVIVIAYTDCTIVWVSIMHLIGCINTVSTMHTKPIQIASLYIALLMITCFLSRGWMAINVYINHIASCGKLLCG